jgi:2-dehydropantoate 2-reductase
MGMEIPSREVSVEIKLFPSLERGRPTEIDYLNGYICDRAAEHDIPVPLNQAVVAMIKEIEAVKRPMSIANMDDPVFAGF